MKRRQTVAGVVLCPDRSDKIYFEPLIPIKFLLYTESRTAPPSTFRTNAFPICKTISNGSNLNTRLTCSVYWTKSHGIIVIWWMSITVDIIENLSFSAICGQELELLKWSEIKCYGPIYLFPRVSFFFSEQNLNDDTKRQRVTSIRKKV